MGPAFMEAPLQIMPNYVQSYLQIKVLCSVSDKLLNSINGAKLWSLYGKFAGHEMI